uniref:myb-related transcription factor, partner of profilin-like n=1 Tax=Myxine glutinosa TaxID=7769 RepID=UPI0035902021
MAVVAAGDEAPRKRKQRFSESELEVLLSEVERRKTMLFGVRGQPAGATRSSLAWALVARRVGAVAGVSRDGTSVRKRWNDAKRSVSRKMAGAIGCSAAGDDQARVLGLSSWEQRVANVILDGEIGKPGGRPEAEIERTSSDEDVKVRKCSNEGQLQQEQDVKVLLMDTLSKNRAERNHESDQLPADCLPHIVPSHATSVVTSTDCGMTKQPQSNFIPYHPTLPGSKGSGRMEAEGQASRQVHFQLGALTQALTAVDSRLQEISHNQVSMIKVLQAISDQLEATVGQRPPQ